MIEPLLTAQQVAETFNLSLRTIYRLKDKPGGLPAYKVGGSLRFKHDEVEAYISGQTVKPAIKQEYPVKTRFKYVPGMKVV